MVRGDIRPYAITLIVSSLSHELVPRLKGERPETLSIKRVPSILHFAQSNICERDYSVLFIPFRCQRSAGHTRKHTCTHS